MKCPVCPSSELRMAEREGVEIDYCPICRGVWLDRGELDQIIRRASQEIQAENRDERDERDRHLMNRHDGHRHGDSRDRQAHPRRRKSFLNGLFDFD